MIVREEDMDDFEEMEAALYGDGKPAPEVENLKDGHKELQEALRELRDLLLGEGED